MSQTNEPSYLEKVFNNIKSTTINTYANVKNQTMSLKNKYWDKMTGGKRNRKRKTKRSRIKTPFNRKRKNLTKKH